MFITFEGVDGSGKTTQVSQTADYLREQGYDVLATREPGGTPIGDQIRELLLENKDDPDIHAHTELLLFCASRAQLIAEVVLPHLRAGGIVISDRYTDSTYAYQGYGHGLNVDKLKQINDFATTGLHPDLTIFLDITPKEALKRRAAGTLFGQTWNRLDDMDIAFHERVYKGYREMILADPARFTEVDATVAPEVIQAKIRDVLAEALAMPTDNHTRKAR